MSQAYRDENNVPTLIASSNVDGFTPVRVYADPITHRLLVDLAGGGSGTVTSVSVVTANGFAGTVANSTTTPAITLSTTITGILKGNGTSIAAGVASDVDSILPTQTGNSGKFLTTNGTVSSWGTPSTSGGITIGTTVITSGTTTRILYDNAGVVGEYTLTGTGTVVVMATSPTLITPVLGVATATSINKMAITAPATSSTLAVADGKTFTISNTLTFTGTDSSSVAFGAGGTVLYTNSTVPLTVGTTTIASGTSTRILYDNAGVLGEYTISGTGTVVAMQTAPTFVTSIQSPRVIGGSGTTGTQLILQTTTGVGTTDAITFAGGTNGGTTFGTLTSTGLNINTTGVFTTGTIELGAVSDTTLARVSAGVISVEGVTIDTISATNTLTNKRIQPRTVSTASYTTDTGTSLTVATTDQFVITAQAGALKFNNPGGSPVNGEKLIIRIKDNGTARVLTYDTQFRASSDLALPTTTILSKTLYMGFIFNSTDTTWDLLAVLNNF